MRDFSYGFIPLRKGPKGWEVAIVSHHKGFWGFPKGHLDEGETPRQGAERELLEETGLKVVRYLSDEEFSENYHFFYQHQRIYKTVVYFIAIVEGVLTPQKEELADAQWVPLDKAEQRLTYPESQSIARKVIELLRSKST